MNSLTDKDFEERLDQLLTSSVSPGSEPDGFTIARMPRRPRFNGALLVGAVTGIAVLGALLLRGLLELPFERMNAEAAFSDLGLQMSDYITAGALGLVSPTCLMYAAGLMAVVLLYFAHRIMLLYRFH